MTQERPAVVLANTASGDRAFLSVFLQKGPPAPPPREPCSNFLLQEEVPTQTFALNVDISMASTKALLYIKGYYIVGILFRLGTTTYY